MKWTWVMTDTMIEFIPGIMDYLAGYKTNGKQYIVKADINILYL